MMNYQLRLPSVPGLTSSGHATSRLYIVLPDALRLVLSGQKDSDQSLSKPVGETGECPLRLKSKPSPTTANHTLCWLRLRLPASRRCHPQGDVVVLCPAWVIGAALDWPLMTLDGLDT